MPCSPLRRPLLGLAAGLLAAAAAGCGAGSSGGAADADAAEYDVVLAGGRVMDPESGLDAVRNVGIQDGRIAAIAEGALRGRETVDVSGLVVAPGFIDLHAHGQDSASNALQVRDGVTTTLEQEQGIYPVGAFLASREGKSISNYGGAVSHQGARVALMHGIDALHLATNDSARARLPERADAHYRPATPAQIEELEGLMGKGLDEGGLGLGFGINYTPGARPEEIDSLFALAARRRVPVFVHTRDFGIPAIREVLATAERTGAALHIVHIGSSTMRQVDEALALIDAAKARGQDVTTEVYPYTAGSTRLESAIFDPGWQEKLSISYGDLEWPATGERLTRQTFDSYRAQGGWVILHMIPETTVEKALRHPGVMVASDGVPFVGGRAHPRGAGTYARVLGLYVRERKVLGLMDALSRMSYLPARRLEGVAPALAAKGRVKVGADADLVVFDPATVIDRATFAEPAQASAGIPHVLVGGVFVVRGGEPVAGARPGKAVRGTAPAASAAGR